MTSLMALRITLALEFPSRLTLDEWDESKHPRQPDGKFGKGSTAKGTSDKIELEIAGVGKAYLPMAKLTQYALNPAKSPDKARAFELALGYHMGNVDALIENVRRNINRFPVEEGPSSEFGEKFQIRMWLKGSNGKMAKVMTGWLKDWQTKEIHLTTIFVDK